MEKDKNDLTEFNTGGTHEQNPQGGIQQGTGPNGQPNTVEEGETKFKIDGRDYIYSNRIDVQTQLVQGYNLPGYIVGKSYADASKRIERSFKDRNDNASISTKETLLKRLSESQEMAKLMQQADEAGMSVPEYIKAQQEQEVSNNAQQATAAAEQGVDVEKDGNKAQPQNGTTPQVTPQVTPQGNQMNPSMQPTQQQFGKGGELDAITSGLGTVTSLYSQMQTDSAATEHKSIVGGAAKGILQGAVGGATAGAALGPAGVAVGAVGGAIVGLGTGIAGTITGNVKANYANRVEQDVINTTRLKTGQEPSYNAYGGYVNNQYSHGSFLRGPGDKLGPLTPEEQKVKDKKDAFNILNPSNDFGVVNTSIPIRSSESVSSIINPSKSATTFNNINPAVKGQSFFDSQPTLLGKDNFSGNFSSNNNSSNKINYAGIAGAAAGLAPVLGNLLEGSNLKAPAPNRIDTAGRTYIPDFADSQSALNVVDQSFAGSDNSIANATLGDLGAYRANLLGANVSKSNARNEAYNRIEQINRGERKNLNADFSAVSKENVAARNLEVERNLADRGAYDKVKAQFRASAYTSLGELGKTIFGVSQYGDALGYDFLGNKKKTGS